MLVADLFGRLEIALKYEGLALAAPAPTWIKLPPKQAIADFKRRKVMTRKQFDKLSDAMKQRSFTAAYLQHDYQLAQLKGAINKALAGNETMGTFVSKMRERLKAWGVTASSPHHLETVYTTNLLGSYQHGRFKQMNTPKMKKRRPYWQYETAGDRRVRPTHQAMDQKVYPADHAFWSSWYPPNGFRCRCTVHPLSRYEVRELEIEGELPGLDPDEGFGSSPREFLKQRGSPEVLPPTK